ncbi:penicillin-binding transpeptidase domain-containing protein [Mesobacillus selenatarsenatis]|uniref:serine-type D-Ala-D-Ala carboxypeptidase n=1 Tax=Mesobacillus selenatarsenatis (strain DSM 18680 / JCM 14380 / FERM P-15431 / SF-1) TaxID=1321606 RepID=A0A0A8X081_MESS1|nr:penicillin-binding transpeptidase domain-containing protein [Mesobacillus selenatarsenatis]GAM12659.1 cell division protein FtsI [peptidoglycan synthetase] [Mesobacillus selenatarsenatis SF-1]
MKRALFIFLSVLIAALISGCSKEPTPEERFSQYVKLWNDQKFDEMYGFLSEKAKNSITKEEFVSRYNKIYKDLEINQLKVSYKQPEEEQEHEANAELPFSAKLNSAAGPIEFDHNATLVKEEREKETNWYVDWNTSFIFPELEAGDKISFKNVQAERGSILDRSGNGLAINGTAVQVGVVPGELAEPKDQTIAKLAELLDMSEESINKAMNAGWVKPDLFVPLKKVSKTDKGLHEKLFALDGVTSQMVGAREYPYGEALSHLLGYIGPVTADDLKKLEGKGYTSTDIIGRRGLEQVLEEKLKGTNGVRISIVKEDGTVKTLAEKPVENGQDVQLTIDVVAQQQLYDQLKGKAGTASAINPTTGETLALVSAPGFDPNEMTLGISQNKRKILEEDPLKPFLNRFKLTYVPGSVIKPITAAIGLESDKLKLDTAFEINEKQWQKDASWGNYKVTRYSDVKGSINLEKALIYSDNIYFARAALGMGQDTFTEGLKKFGFEDQPEYLYPIEPSQIGKIDSEIRLADSAYGQGQVEMNILHLATTYSPLLNEGNLIKPILNMEDEQGQVWQEGVVSPENAAALSNMLTKVITDPKGTAHNGLIANYPLAGKTGTAEIKEKQGEKGKELGWFVAYNPQSTDMIVAMMIEDSGSKDVVTRVKEFYELRLQSGM